MRIALLINIFLFSIYLLPGQTTVITVTNKDDNSNSIGCLRWALDSADSVPGGDVIIEFDLPESLLPFDIFLTGQLLINVDNITIDGTTQKFGVISIHGEQSGSFIEWYANGGALYGIQIVNNGDFGMELYGSGNQIGAPGKGNSFDNHELGGILLRNGAENNYLQGNTFSFNSGPGIEVDIQSLSINNYIGGLNPGEGNTISNNTIGIYKKNISKLSISGNYIYGNNEGGIYIFNEQGVDAAHILSNSIFCNQGLGIRYYTTAQVQPPGISTATTTKISGTATQAQPGDSIEVFLSSQCISTFCEGEFPMGTTVVKADKTWELTGGFYSPDFQASAVVIDMQGRTSAFSACQSITCSVSDLVVRSTAEDGLNTLKAAITCAKYLPEPRIITFDFDASETKPYIISFPNTNKIGLEGDQTIIDGTTQPGYSPGDIILDGANFAQFLAIDSDSCQVYGLHFRNFIEAGMTVSGRYCQIGAPGKGNIITQNLVGIQLIEEGEVSNHKIQGNYIGTTPDSFPPLGNALGLSLIVSNNVLIGGSTPGEGNTIAYNDTTIKIFSLAFPTGLTVSQNRMFCNKEGIIYTGFINNNDIPSPIILSADLLQIKGTAPPTHTVEVFFQDSSLCESEVQACQGKTFVSKTIADADGNWSILSNSAFAGKTLTATATDILGNTSGFGDCYTLSEDKSFVDSIDIPQAFTPGNDGFNDRFIIPNISNYPDNELIVLNGWGNQVYYSRPYKNDWTGTTSNGNDLLEGTYFYVLRIFINGNRNIKRGTITIVR